MEEKQQTMTMHCVQVTDLTAADSREARPELIPNIVGSHDVTGLMRNEMRVGKYLAKAIFLAARVRHGVRSTVITDFGFHIEIRSSLTD